MLSVESSSNSNRLEGSWVSNPTSIAVPSGSHSQSHSRDVLLSTAVALSSSPVFTRGLGSGGGRERESVFPLHSSDLSSDGNNVEHSHIDDFESDDWMPSGDGNYLTDFDDVSVTASDDLDFHHELYYFVEEPSKKKAKCPEHHCKERKTKSQKSDWDKKHYYQRLLSLSRGKRERSKEKQQQYKRGLKEKRSGLFQQEEVIFLERSADDREEFLVVD
ncbi:uncharacterized protein [Oscarella lobularis]|uniref:uncharacterized protein n=1 Tax=Oscarella lobularis TaxID=121494 RepID=UPI003313D0C1